MYKWLSASSASVAELRRTEREYEDVREVVEVSHMDACEQAEA